jgi:hypothetical protein
MAYDPNDPRIDTYRSDPNQTGIDLKRSVIKTNLGTHTADPAATFRMGSILAKSAAGLLVPCDGLGSGPSAIPFGMSKWNKDSHILAAKVDEAVILTALVASNLKKAGLFGSSPGVSVRSAPNMGGTAYTEGTDFSVNYTNGQVTRINGGAIASGQTVYVTYQYFLLEQDLDFQGRNFYNFLDDVTIHANKITVIQDWALVFTTMYDPARTYGMSDPLYVDGAAKAGLLTNNSAGGRPRFGTAVVDQLPTAGDPFLGIRFQI